VPSEKMKRVWLTPAAKKTKAGAVVPISVGQRIPLGNGAEARVIASNGKIFGFNQKLPFARNENDRSVALYVKYRQFDYILDGDIGSGPEKCTSHDTSQRNFQVPVARALIDLKWMDAKHGVDVLHIAHHGSESSTSAEYYNLMKPEVGLISVGLNQGTFLHPRIDVVDKVLLPSPAASAGCVSAPPLAGLFQTEEGLKGTSTTGATSFLGKPLGDIKLETDGVANYKISGSGRTRNGNFVKNPPGGSWCFPLDSAGLTVANSCKEH
jgi:hypothetical protein